MRVEVQIEIDRSVEDVFAYITNFENNPKWQKGMVSCTFTTEPPVGKGTRYTQVAQFMGRTIESKFLVTKYIPDERVEFETTESTFPIQIVRSVSAANGGTQVNAIISGQPDGLMKFFAPLAQIMMRRSIEADYARLKALLEQEVN
jgi:uncharacterized membrane protein